MILQDETWIHSEFDSDVLGQLSSAVMVCFRKASDFLTNLVHGFNHLRNAGTIRRIWQRVDDINLSLKLWQVVEGLFESILTCFLIYVELRFVLKEKGVEIQRSVGGRWGGGVDGFRSVHRDFHMVVTRELGIAESKDILQRIASENILVGIIKRRRSR